MRAFEGCWQRIERADAHRKAFGKLWDAVASDMPYSPIFAMKDDGTGVLWVKPTYSELSPLFSLTLGEFLYQLRAALDGCVYQATILESGKNPPPNEKNLAFPICSSPAKFKSCAGNISPLSEKHRDIIESVQPYNAPKLEPEFVVLNFNRALDILNDWARKDRHRTLHVVGSWASRASPKLRLPEGVTVASMTVHGSGFLEGQRVIATLKLNGFIPGMKGVQANPDLAIDIAVDEIPPPCADNDTLGNRMIAMDVATKSIVGTFEKSFGF